MYIKRKLVWGAKVDDLKLNAFMKLVKEYAPDTYQYAMEDCEDDPAEIPDWFECCTSDAGDGILGFLCDIMNAEEGFEFFASDDDDVVYIERGFPWEIPDSMIGMTETDLIEKLKDWLVPYFKSVEFGYFSIIDDD